jgi:hypothetical protein
VGGSDHGNSDHDDSDHSHSEVNTQDTKSVALSSTPGGRVDAVSWVDANSQTLFLFAGYGRDGQGELGYLNDLWTVDTSHHAVNFGAPEVYGVLVVLAVVALLLCLVVVSLYARDGRMEWRRGMQSGARYDLLHDNDT